MTIDTIFSLADSRATLETVGGKGASLARLVQAGLPVPGGFHITTAAYRQFVAANALQPLILAALATADITQPASLEAASATIHGHFAQASLPADLASAITQAYAAFSPTEAHLPVAVRSSATAEDLPELSFAGQQDTFLNIRGPEALLDAVQRCWASLWTARAIGYRLQHHIDQTAVSLAVVVQQLVLAEAAGVLFTAHPVSGRRDQALLTATWGLGEAIVGGLVTPDTLTVDKASGRVLSRETAEKLVMTVRVAHGTEEQPVPEAQRRAPVLSDAQAAELVQFGTRIEQHYGLPMDIEWTLAAGEYAGSHFAIVQARPITALPEPEVPAPQAWKLSKGQYAAVRNNIVELMPDPLTPLFGSWGRAIINASLGRLLALFVRQGDRMLPELVITVNGYAYNNGSVKPVLLLPLIFDTPAILRRMFTGAVERWTEAGRPRYVATVEHWQTAPWRELSSTALLNGAREVFEAAIDAYGALISGVIPAAWITEALFTTVYNTLLKRRGDPPAAICLLGFDSAPIRAEKSLYDLAEWARARASLAAYLRATPAPQLAAQLRSDPPHGVPAGLDDAEWHEWQHRLQAHLQQHGHVFYNLDFANAVPADDPTPVLETCKLFLRGQGTNPYTRQQAAAERREQTTQALAQRLRGWRLNLFRKFCAPAQRYAPLREDGLADVGLGYPLLRQMFRELGRRLVEGGLLAEADDVFWLEQAEVAQAASQLDSHQALTSLATLISQRKARWQAARRVTPPLMLPQMKFFGVDLMEIRTGHARKMAAKVIKGVAASSGTVTAPARVLRGPEDFGQMQPGEVLVAAITTPAWTPLFAMASAVVTDIGGPLSHGSIVAREYGLPAVLGTGVATARIHNGQMLTVDGTAGTVTLLAEPAAPGPSVEWKLPQPKGRYMRGSLVDFMPDPLSPLFATLGLSAVFAGLRRVMRMLTQSEPILPADYFTTINHYAYMGFGYTAREWWWIISRMMTTALPRILRIGPQHWRKDVRPRYAEVVSRWQARPVAELSPAELLRGVYEIMDLAGEYIGALMIGTMGASAGTEGLFTRVYDKLVKKTGDPAAPAFLMGYDSLPIQSEKSLYDLAAWLRPRPALADSILQTPAAQQAAAGQPAGVSPEDWAAWQQRWETHLRRYGHIVYNLDFAQPLPVDDPTPMLEVCRMYLRGEGGNPHERQKGLADRREQATQTMQQRLKGWRRWAFNQSLRLGQSLAAMREDAIADMGLGYPQLRALLHELGQRLAAAGALEQAADIFWLEKAQLASATAALEAPAGLEATALLASLAPMVRANRAADAAARRLTPPPMLPPMKKYLGIDISAFTPTEQQAGDTLKGVAASAGRVTAPARVLHGPGDFGQMQPGEVLVAAITTPAWTPLFAMASAVVTDVGGPLSHGSIVAREYNIPAVMGTGVATRRIQNGQVITVDGSAGVVSLAK